ncbi:TonB family protein [Sphingomonas bacterium]|uniref:TonB family protein n=1 Tax=Sphingomonas bacterium TaxID=1895847 RepID=UPI0015766EBD|nr:TonB family protein [Sphingomonas bacterium]
MRSDWLFIAAAISSAFPLAPQTVLAEDQQRLPAHDILVPAADYPALAMRMRHEGRVRYRGEYGQDGLLASCTINESSGYPELDTQACKLLKRRSHAQPQSPGFQDGSTLFRLSN